MVQILDSMAEHIPFDFHDWKKGYQQDFVDGIESQDVLKMNIAMRLARIDLKMTPEIEQRMAQAQKEYTEHIKSYWETTGEYLGQAMGLRKVKGKWIR